MKNRLTIKLATLFLLSISSIFAQEISIPDSNEVIIKIPQVPEVVKVEAIVPKAVTVTTDGSQINTISVDEIYPTKKKHIFSNHVAPDRHSLKKSNEKKKEALAGDIVNGRVAAYLHAPLVSVDEAQAKLKNAGFNILNTFKIDKKGTATSIIFTNKEIEAIASKKIRGFASTLRLVVDKKNKLISISNPIYVMGAFMQKEYDQKLAETTLKQIRDVFSDVKNSNEIVKFKLLERFRFMENMPYYQDMKLVKKGKNKTLLKKAKKSKKIVYEQHLANGSIIIGVKLGKRTSKFVKKIGYQNAGLLPYPVLIENGEAKFLAPQYYIAIMYPMLKMSQFMKIATVPGAITKDIDKIFR